MARSTPALWLFVALAAGRPEVATARPTGNTAYHWPHSRGHVGSYGKSSLRGPRNLTEAFLWKWHHPKGRFATIVTGGAIFDESRNIFVTTEAGIWKLSPEGKTLWFHYTKDMGEIPSASSIGDGLIFGCTKSAVAFALRMTDGQEVWRRRVHENTPGDTAYVEMHNGVVIIGADQEQARGGGAQLVLGINASNGEHLWDFRPDSACWNFQAQFSSDGESLIFMDIRGKGYRIGLHDGRLIWKARPGAYIDNSFTDGGATLAEDLGMVFTVAATTEGYAWRPDSPGVVYALNFTDGQLIWQQWVPRIPNSWPAVGPLQPGAKPSVVMPVGMQGGLPWVTMLPNWLPRLMRKALHHFFIWWGDWQSNVEGLSHGPLPNDIHAFDAATGAPQWMWKGPIHRRIACAGDEEGFLIREELFLRTVCWPGPWSAPTVDAAGTVYVGAQTGHFVAIWDGNGDGKIDDATEVSMFDTGASALHPGPALAPGLLAYPTCDSLFVFKSPS